MNIELESLERLILINALTQPAYKDIIETPATQKVVRDTYKNLLSKLKGDEILSRRIRGKMK